MGDKAEVAVARAEVKVRAEDEAVREEGKVAAWGKAEVRAWAQVPEENAFVRSAG